MNLTDRFYWEIRFADGRRLTQIENNRKHKAERARIARLQPEFGQAVEISLRPTKGGEPVLTVAVPGHCRPYFGSRTILSGPDPIGRAFVVGYSDGTTRRLTPVHWTTGAIGESFEEPV